MNAKVNELTVDELKEVIEKSVKEAIEDYLEDQEALSSPNFIKSIHEAREDYKAGRVTPIEDILID